jgi:glycosyltransferase involved in cell wall biosynthesis
MPCICILPRVDGPGGVTSFRLKFENGLRARGVDITYDISEPADVALVLAGTKRLFPLWKAHARGQRIVQRLDGVNWVHRARWAGLKYTLRAIYGNWNLSFIRRQFADKVIYQSQFIKGWWESWYGAARVPASVILNGVDLTQYTPNGPHARPNDLFRILIVEGSMAGAQNSGLFNAVELATQVAQRHTLEVCIVGHVDERTKAALRTQDRFAIRFMDTVSREQIPQLMRSAHALFSAEINPPCPNSVIEALACGLPVIGFDTGSLAEIVQGDAGRLAKYEANPWKLEKPDVSTLARAAEEVLLNNAHFRISAREQAESKFGLDAMVDAYLKVLLPAA